MLASVLKIKFWKIQKLHIFEQKITSCSASSTEYCDNTLTGKKNKFLLKKKHSVCPCSNQRFESECSNTCSKNENQEKMGEKKTKYLF